MAVHAGVRPGVLAAGVFLVSVAVYLATLAPTVTFVDSGELIAAAKSLGVAHPPGFPLYTLIGHAATWLPIGSVAQRVHLASAVFSAVAAAALTASVLEVLRRQGASRPAGWPEAVAALAGGLLFAFSRTLWSYATVAEVYALNIALVLLVLVLVLRWTSRGGHVAFYAAAALFGLALGVHHVTVGLTVPALIWLVLRARGGRFLVGRKMLFATLIAFGAAVLVYASLPLAASRAAGLNWGDPDTLQRLWWHVSGRQYQSFFDFSWSQLGENLADEARFVARQFGPVWLPLALAAAVIGAVRLFLRDSTVFWFLVLLVVPNLGYGLVYVISEDKDAYLLPTYAALALAAGVGVYAILTVQRLPGRAAATLTIAVAVLVGISFATSLRFDDRHSFHAAHDYADGILGSVGPRGFLLTYDWQVYSPLLYELEVEHRRPDVVAVDGNLLRRSWYFDYLARRYPDLLRRARVPVRLYLEDLRSWEQDHGRYARGHLNRRIEARFQAVIAAFVRLASESGPVFATQDIAVEGNTAARLARRYTFAPQGPVLRLFPDSRFHEPPMVPVRLRGVTDGGVRLERDDVVREKVLPAILRMLTLRALYLGYYGRRDAARKALAEADRFRRRWGL